MGVRYWDAEGFGGFILQKRDGDAVDWVRRENGAFFQEAGYTIPWYENVYKAKEVFPAWASDAPSQPSEEKDLSDVNIIREALDGQRGEHQKLIAEYGVEVVATLIRVNGVKPDKPGIWLQRLTETKYGAVCLNEGAEIPFARGCWCYLGPVPEITPAKQRVTLRLYLEAIDEDALHPLEVIYRQHWLLPEDTPDPEWVETTSYRTEER